ncbi:hypothetical protein ACS0PU_003550 [Formica fusca]
MSSELSLTILILSIIICLLLTKR